MRDLAILFIHLIAIVAKVPVVSERNFFVPDGTCTVQAGKDHLVLRYDENNKVPLETGEFYNRMFGGRTRFDRTAEDELVLVWVAGSREIRAPRVQE